MSKIALLSQETIDKIAAGEVVERPSSVVKELVENAIDAGASAITVEIKEGGISLIRITDNGCGIPKEEVPLAFLRHSTSKIRSAEDLMCVHSLGFRGEALSSIAAVSRVEMITKPADALTGTRYVIEGSKEIADEEIGAPDGTTFLVRDLFYNTPARRKFLKTAQTEGTYISDMLEKLALSHPDISFKYINNNQTRLHTSGNGKKRDLIYHIYGREIAAALLEVNYKGEYFSLSGYIGKPVINRGNRNYENYFINGRYIKSSLLSRSIEEAYHNFLMQHQYPFTVLYFTFPEDTLDVNVHPTKMELRFGHNQEIYKELCDVLFGLLSHKELIPEVPVDEAEHKKKNLPPAYKEPIPEPFEKRRINEIRQQHHQPPIPEKPVSPVALPVPSKKAPAFEPYVPQHPDKTMVRESFDPFPKREESVPPADLCRKQPAGEQMTLAAASPEFLTDDARKKHRIIGQLFQTYWLIEYEDKLYIMDQHAALTSTDASGHEVIDKTVNPLFDYLIDRSAFTTEVEKHKASPTASETVYSPAADVYLIENAGTYALPATVTKGIVIATGDVRVSGQFEGMIISGGVISFDSNASVRGNKLLVSQLFTEDQKRDTPLFSQFFKGCSSLAASNISGNLDLDSYLNYDNWKKNG